MPKNFIKKSEENQNDDNAQMHLDNARVNLNHLLSRIKSALSLLI